MNGPGCGRGFGSVLRAERGVRPQAWLAEVTGLSLSTVKRLEQGSRRPTTSTTWRLARGLRPRGSLRDRVALDQRLREAAGASLQYAATRPHVARERVRAELLAESDNGVVVSDHYESLGSTILADLARAAAAAGLDGGSG